MKQPKARLQELGPKYRSDTLSTSERSEYVRLLAEAGLRLHARLRTELEPVLRLRAGDYELRLDCATA
jgi:hypothetical protein